jgi:hypothetical protein
MTMILRAILVTSVAVGLSACTGFDVFKDSSSQPAPTLAPEPLPTAPPVNDAPTKLSAAQIKSLLTGKSPGAGYRQRHYGWQMDRQGWPTLRKLFASQLYSTGRSHVVPKLYRRCWQLPGWSSQVQISVITRQPQSRHKLTTLKPLVNSIIKSVLVWR